MRVAVIGLGFVGLPVAVLLARSGHEVVGYDVDYDRMVDIVSGEAAKHEPGLTDLLNLVLVERRLELAGTPDAIGYADAALIAVPTPLTAEHRPDYGALLEAIETARKVVRPGGLVIVESTLAPQTCARLLKPLLPEQRLAYCPERVMPGRALYNLTALPRVLGAEAPGRDGTELVTLYGSFCAGRLSVTDWLTAELVKTGENAYRDVQIAFANELAALCEEYGADMWSVREQINQLGDREVLEPGAGVGGHCLPKDPWLLIGQRGAPLILAARSVNQAAPLRLQTAVLRALQAAQVAPAQARVVLLGETYRPGIPDTRHSPAHALRCALAHLETVLIHDPLTNPGDLYAMAAGADALVLLTAHAEYGGLDWERLRTLMRNPLIIDGRGLWRDAYPPGFLYYVIGRGYEH